MSRRDFLTIGGMMLGGLSLPQLLRAEAQSGMGSSHKAIINIYLPGGPPHLDMWDIKPDAPREIRGEFNPIRTNVPGIDICEHFPRIARMADKFVFIRSLVDCDGDHDAYQCMTGRKKNAADGRLLADDGRVGVAASRDRSTRPIPPNLSLMYPHRRARAGAIPATAASSAWPTIRSPGRPARQQDAGRPA